MLKATMIPSADHFPRTPWTSGFAGVFLLASACISPAQEVNLPTVRAIEQAFQNILPQAMPATVGIGLSGSGVIVTPDGYVLTVHHAVQQEGGTVELRLHDGRGVNARVLGGDKATDTRILKITESGTWPFAPMTDAQTVSEVGEWVMGLGHAGGVSADRPAQARLGRVQGGGNDGIRTDCAMGPGDSGGPLIDRAGRVIGIHRSATARQSDHISIKIYQSAWDEWILRDASKVSRRAALPAFSPNAERVGRSVVRLRCNGRPAALGTIVSNDGLLISKSSQLCEPIVMDVPGGNPVAASVVSRSHIHDVVLLKVKSDHLGDSPVIWDATRTRRAKAARLFSFVAVTAPSGQPPLAVGVVSADVYPIPDLATRLGMELDEVKDGQGVRVIGLTPGGVAAKSIRIDDVFTHINKEEIHTRDDLFEELDRPGRQSVELTMRRGGVASRASFSLGNPSRHATDTQASRRRNGFPHCFQHDAPISPEDCGGPLIDLDGEVIGINIARSSHSAALAIPTDIVREVVRELKAGGRPQK
jgi:serine protease Do